jgi:hypothetical protein
MLYTLTYFCSGGESALISDVARNIYLYIFGNTQDAQDAWECLRMQEDFKAKESFDNGVFLISKQLDTINSKKIIFEAKQTH